MSTVLTDDGAAPPPDPSGSHTGSPTAQHQPNTQDAPAASRSWRPPPSNSTVYQTTGPDAYTGPIMAPDGSGPVLNPRSCVTCRRRKVRCDKQMPCSNCRRALIPCVFPAPGRAPRQPRPRDPNAPPKAASQREVELVKRLRKLEGIVEELSGQIEVESGSKGESSTFSTLGSPGSSAAAGLSGSSRRGTASLASNPQSGSDREPAAWTQSSDDRSASLSGPQSKTLQGRLVLNDHKGNTRYVTNGFWAKISDEISSLREDASKLSDLESDDSDYEESPADSPSMFKAPWGNHHSFILGYGSADVDLSSFHPKAAHVPFLWSVYQDNVDPMIKVLHVPTTDAIMREARKNPQKLSPGNEAVVFAIYFGALISLEEDEVMANFNTGKDEILQRFRFAVEQALARANFLYTSDLAVLQAFTLLLTTVRRVDDSRFCWTLTSLVVRIARGMGLHCDGSRFDLTPFETEMRRRLWWAIMTLDARSAEELGTELIVGESSFDTRPPLNINDVDISPASTEPPEPREGPSDTAAVLARYEMVSFARRHIHYSARSHPIGHEEAEKSLVLIYRRIERRFLDNVLDETDPLCWAVTLIARLLVGKMSLSLYQHQMFPGADAELSVDTRERLFVAAIEVVEITHGLSTDARFKQFRWLFMSYTNWHAVAFSLIQLCRRPFSALVERAWEAVNAFEPGPDDKAKRGDHAAFFLPLRKLYARARKHRESEIARLRADLDEARRLDWEDQANQASTQRVPLPDAEAKMDRVREKWWKLINPDGSPPPPPPTLSTQPPPSASHDASSGGAGEKARDPQTGAPHAGFPDETMEILDDLMAQPNNPVMTSFFVLNMGHDAKNLDLSATGDVNAMAPSEQQLIQPPRDTSLRQQALALQAQAASREGHDTPPHLWSNAFGEPVTPMQRWGPNPYELGDVEMLDGGFDWQDWGQCLQSLDMLGMHPPL